MNQIIKTAVGVRVQLAQSRQNWGRAGFTLIEILIVMVLIGILVALSVGSFQSSQLKARDSRRKSDLKQIGLALEAYYNDYGAYPASSADFRILGCSGGGACDWDQPFVDAQGTQYMTQLPRDPRSYTYHYSSSGVSYQLYARLENVNDGAIQRDGSDDPLVYSGVSCGNQVCNYGIASANTTANEGRVLTAE